jgi:autotransporter-associated beta strand protein
MKIFPSATAAHKKILLGLLGIALGWPAGRCQQLAFPGAQGFGQYATGGRGGTVYHVTTLADSGAGSFRDAVSQANRTIVFDVGGYINLLSAVSASSSLTIAGQTAPGGGIGIMGAELSFYGKHNIICRDLRVRQGGSSTSQSGISIGATSSTSPATNMIFDHISVEFGQWDSIDAVNTANVTVQDSIIADPINQQFGAHVEGYNLTWYGNLWANCHNRQPLAKADTIFINNVVYNFQAAYTTGDTGAAHNHDIINNYFISGPSTSSPQDDFFQINGTPQNLYFTGNLLDSDKNGLLGGSTTTPSPDNNGRTGNVLTSPWSPVTATIPAYSTVAGYRADVSSAGAFPRDDLDANVVGQVTSLGTAGAIITSPSSTGLENGGYGTIDGGTALTDTDGDGMPDIWEKATGSNPLVADNNTVAADGYTLLEHYLNWMAGPHAFVQTNATDIDLWPYTLGFTNGATYTLFNATNGSVTLTNSHFAHFVPSPGFTGLASFNFVVTNPDGSAMTNTMGLLVSIIYIPKNLIWRGDGINNIWDTTNTADWFNGNDPDTFNAGDNVTFDDTGSASPAINITGTVAPGKVIVDADQNYTFGGTGAIAGAGSFTKSGTGTLLVNNNNTFTGPLTVNGGLIQYNNNAYLGSGNITLNGAALSFSLSGSGTYLTLANNLSVSAGTTNTIILSQRETLGGTVTNTGTLNLVAPSTLGGTRDYLSGSWSQFAGTLNISGGAMLDCKNNGGAFDGFNNANVTISNETVDVWTPSGGGTYNIGALSGNAGAYLLGSEGGGAATWQIGGLNLNTTFAGAIQNGGSSTAAITKIGTGTLALSGNSTHTGATVVNNGTLLVTGNISASPVTVVKGGTLQGTGFFGGGVTIQSGGIISPGPGNGGAGTMTVSNNLTLAAPVLNFDLSSSPAGANDQIVMQGGTLAMSGVQTYNFNLLNNALGAGDYYLIIGATNSTAWSGVADNLPFGTRQTIILNRPAAGSNPSYTRLSVAGNAVSLVWSGTNGGAWDLSTTTNWLNGSAADEFYNLDFVRFDDTSTNGNVSLAGTLQPAAILVTNNFRAYTFGGSGALGGFGTLTKAGSGTLTLSTTNGSYTGNILLTGGSTWAGVGANLGTGTLSISGGAGFNLPSGESISLPIFIPAGQSGTLHSGGLGNSVSGTISSGDSSSVLNLSGGVSFGGASSSQFDNFTGTINIPAGSTLRYSPNSSGNTYGSLKTALVINGTLQPRNAGNTVQLGAFSGSGTLSGPQSNAGSGDTLYVIGGNNADASFSGVISSNTAVAGSAVIVSKVGAGTLSLSGNSTYTGGTTVNAGTLAVNNPTGSGTGSGAVTVNNGATLAGAGTIGGAVTIAAGGILAPGAASPGTLTINGDLSLDDASTLQFQLGATSDRISVVGDLTLGGTLNLSNAGGFGPGTYTLFNYGGALNLGTLVIGTTPANFTCTIDTSVPGQVNLIVSLPQFGNIRTTPAGLVMNGSNGAASAIYYLLAATNLAEPPANWTRVLTNQFDGDGNFDFTNAISPNSPESFYRLQVP